MTARDIYRFINEQDDNTIQKIIDRLEFRGKDPTFTGWIEAYLNKIFNEVGTGSFFLGAAETYAPLIAQAGLLPANQVENWLAEQRKSHKEGTFFASGNYYTYLARRV